MLKSKIAIAIMMKDENSRIRVLADRLENADADKIFIFDDNSIDESIKTIIELGLLKDRFWEIMRFPKTAKLEGIDEKRNYMHHCLKDYDWVLHIDADELFDSFFLKNIKMVIKNAESALSFAFKRINMPNSENYPDYQVRLLRNDDKVQWKGATHEKPFYNDEKESLFDCTESIKSISDDGRIFCVKLEKFPIIHLPRRKDITRPWW